MRYFSCFVFGCTALGMGFASAPVTAQERSAGNGTDLQMTWNSLTSIVQNARTRTELVNSRIEQMVKCNAKFKLYAPGAAGADGEGCIENALLKQLGSRMDAVEANVTDTNNKITVLNGRVATEIPRIDTSLNTLNAKLTALTTRMAGVDVTISNINVRIASLETQVVTINDRIGNIQGVLSKHESRIGNAESRLTTAENRTTNTESRLKSSESQISSLTPKITSLNRDIATLKNQVNDLYDKAGDLYSRTDQLGTRAAKLEAAMNAIRTCGAQYKLTNLANQCVDLPLQKETQYVETPGWIGSPLDLVCTAGRKISYAMVNVSTRSNQTACGRSGVNCDGNATSSLLGLTHWYIDPDPGKVVSAYIECK